MVSSINKVSSNSTADGVFLSRIPHPSGQPERRREQLDALAGQLAVEARQMGAADEEIQTAMLRALESLNQSLRPPTP